MQDGSSSDADELAAVVIRYHFYAWGQGSIGVDFLNLGAQASNHVIGVQRSIHDDDRRNDIVLLIATGFAKPRRIAYGNFGNILDQHRHAICLV